MKAPAEFGNLLTLPQVAERTGLSIYTLRRWASQRRIPIVKISNRVLVTERDLAKLIEAGRKEPLRELAV